MFRHRVSVTSSDKHQCGPSICNKARLLQYVADVNTCLYTDSNPYHIAHWVSTVVKLK